MRIPRPIIDPQGYVQAGRIGYRELWKLFEQTGLILNKFFAALSGRLGRTRHQGL